MTSIASFEGLPDRQLLEEVKRLAQSERDATAALIAALAEIDARRLFLGEGCSSLFTYCTQVLHLSEHAAYGRIEAARAVRRFPLVLERLAAGELTLTAVGLLRAHLTQANYRDLLDSARHRRKREVEELLARLQPRPDVATSVRKLPPPREPHALVSAPNVPPAAARVEIAASSPSAPTVQITPDADATLLPATPPPPPRRAVVMPLAPERYKVQFTVSGQTHDKLRRAQDLLRHSIPNGDPAESSTAR